MHCVCSSLPLKRALPRSIFLIAFRGTNPINWPALALNRSKGPWRRWQPGLIWIQLESSAAIISAKRPGQKVVTVENTYNLKTGRIRAQFVPNKTRCLLRLQGRRCVLSSKMQFLWLKKGWGIQVNQYGCWYLPNTKLQMFHSNHYTGNTIEMTSVLRQ